MFLLQCNGILFFTLAQVDGVKTYGMAIKAQIFLTYQMLNKINA